VTWSLVTAPDERERCCVVIGGVRCEQRSAFWVGPEGGELDDYTITCADHVVLVERPGDRVTPLADETAVAISERPNPRR
jgi:hypothetical protein